MPLQIHYVAMIERFFDEQYRNLADHVRQNPNKTFQVILNELPSDYSFKNKIFAYNNRDGKTFLHRATVEGNTRLVNFLLSAGFEVDRLDKDGKSALYYACDNLDLKTVDTLLTHGADPNMGEDKAIPLVATIQSKKFITVDELSLKEDDFYNIKTDEQAEHTAALIVKKLIEYNVDINLQTSDAKLSPLHRAVASRKPLIVKELIDNNVDCSLLSKDGLSALHIVVEYRSKEEKQEQQQEMQQEKEIANLVIPYSGAVYALQDPEFGNTPLHTAVIGSNPEVVAMLCENDYLFPQLKLLSIRNKEGNTAIHAALLEAQRGPRVLNILLQLATEDDLAVRNFRDESVLFMAERLITEAKYVENLVKNIQIASGTLKNFL